MLFDTHAHIDGERFDKDREALIDNLKNNDIDHVLIPGVDVATSVKAVGYAEKYDALYAGVGIHPHEVKDMDDATIEVLRELAQNDKVVAIGEIGLDYYYDHSPREIQKKWFRQQIKLAKKVGLPIIVHDRDAHQDTFDIIKEEQDGTLTGVMHCYASSVEMAKAYIDLGFYISFAGPVTFKKAKTPKEVAKFVPLDRILIETDSPYLTPEPYRGKRNEPARVRYIAEMVAQLKDVSFKEVATQTTENAKRLFNIK